MAVTVSTRCVGQITVNRSSYIATLDTTGTLTSLKVGDAEVLGGPLDFCPGVRWTAEKVEQHNEGREVHATFRSDRGAGEVTYRFDDRRVMVALTHKLGGYQTWQMAFSDDVIGVEPLQNRNVTGAEAIQYVERGDTRPTPLVGVSRVQRARLHLRNGAKFLFWHDGWGAPFNLDEMGSFRGFTYRRNLLESNKPMRLYFEVESPPGPPQQAGPGYVATGDSFGNVFYVGEPVRFTLKFTRETAERLKLSAMWQVTWRVRDFWSRVACVGKADFEGPAALKEGGVSVEFAPGQPGWFDVWLAVLPFGKVSPQVLPSEFHTRFVGVHRHPAFPDLPHASEAVSDYGYAALMGMRCIRESHVMGQFFPERGKLNWQALDQVFDCAHKESQRWNVNWFFQANEKPGWCDEQDYEQIVHELVTRYKDRCKVWEVENEPNFRFSPEDYVRKALIPFAKGAKRADPQCKIIGPACVALPDTLRFMERIVALDALQYLDEIATHTYVGPGNPWELYGNPQRLQRLRQLAPNKPLWQTEQGYSWGHVSKQEHARYVVRQFLNGFACGIARERHYYFYPVHHGFEPWYLVEMGSSEGLNGTFEPAAVALRVMNEQLAGLTVAEIQQPIFGVHALPFTGGDHDLVVMWTLDFPVTIKVRGRVLEAVDFMGNPRKLKQTHGQVHMDLSGFPVYLRVPHGEQLEFTGPRFGVNYASAEQGARVTASSSTKDHGPEYAIDGGWFPKDPMPQGHPDWVGTYWEDATEGASPMDPDWLQVTFPTVRTINRGLLLTPLPAVSAVPRDFRIEVSSDGKRWKPVAEKKDVVGWATLLTFAPAKAQHVRVVVSKLNDGWHLDGKWMFVVSEDFKRYTSLHTLVCELMVFGP